jgi:hypothetical protein
MPTEWEGRNQALNRIRQTLRENPANLELANRYWAALAGHGGLGDLRTGHYVIDAYREAALRSTEGVVAFSRGRIVARPRGSYISTSP